MGMPAAATPANAVSAALLVPSLLKLLNEFRVRPPVEGRCLGDGHEYDEDITHCCCARVSLYPSGADVLQHLCLTRDVIVTAALFSRVEC